MALLAHSHCSKMNVFETTRSGFSADCFFRDTFKNWNPPFFIGKTHGFRCSDLAQAKTIKNHQKPAVELLDLPFFFGPDLLQQNAPDADRNRFLQPMAPPWHRGFC